VNHADCSEHSQSNAPWRVVSIRNLSSNSGQMRRRSINRGERILGKVGRRMEGAIRPASQPPKTLSPTLPKSPSNWQLINLFFRSPTIHHSACPQRFVFGRPDRRASNPFQPCYARSRLPIHLARTAISSVGVASDGRLELDIQNFQAIPGGKPRPPFVGVPAGLSHGGVPRIRLELFLQAQHCFRGMTGLKPGNA
jgi:hypothetical protein